MHAVTAGERDDLLLANEAAENEREKQQAESDKSRKRTEKRGESTNATTTTTAATTTNTNTSSTTRLIAVPLSNVGAINSETSVDEISARSPSVSDEVSRCKFFSNNFLSLRRERRCV